MIPKTTLVIKAFLFIFCAFFSLAWTGYSRAQEAADSENEAKRAFVEPGAPMASAIQDLLAEYDSTRQACLQKLVTTKKKLIELKKDQPVLMTTCAEGVMFLRRYPVAISFQTQGKADWMESMMSGLARLVVNDAHAGVFSWVGRIFRKKDVIESEYDIFFKSSVGQIESEPTDSGSSGGAASGASYEGQYKQLPNGCIDSDPNCIGI